MHDMTQDCKLIMALQCCAQDFTMAEWTVKCSIWTVTVTATETQYCILKMQWCVSVVVAIPSWGWT